MHPNWFGTVCALGALGAYFVCHRLTAALSLGKRVGICLVALLLAIPGASFALYYAHLLPEREWYYEFRSWRGTECALILLGFAGGAVASLMRRFSTTLPFIGVGLFALVPILKPWVGPIPDSAFQEKWDGAVCLQSTPSTCGAASLATLLRAQGCAVSEKELAREAYSYAGGTEAWYLMRAVRRRGFEPRLSFRRGFDADVPLPAMAGVQVDGFGHFIALLSREGNRFEIGDPLRGREVLSEEELRRRYRFGGFYLAVGK